MAQNFASDYIDVAQRIADFRAAHPGGSLQPANIEKPYDVLTIADQTFIVYAAAAYRTADDQRPGIGVAYEPFPGKSNFTRGSELQNAETSAWGRAIVAALAGDTKRSVASAEEVRNRQAEREPAQPKPAETKPPLLLARERVQAFADSQGWDKATLIANYAKDHDGGNLGTATPEQLNEWAALLGQP